MATDNGVLLAVGVGGPLIGGLLTYLGTRVAAGPSIAQSLTARFSALVDRQEKERAKLEAVARDLEIMVVKLLAWSDEVVEIADERGLDLPPRPRFLPKVEPFRRSM